MDDGRKELDGMVTEAEIVDKLGQVLDKESYEWLGSTHPDIADAIELEVQAGRTPEQIRHFVLKHTQRPELAQRCLQAARHVTVIVVKR